VPWVARLRQSGIRARKISLLSVAEKRRKFHHAAEERKTITVTPCFPQIVNITELAKDYGKTHKHEYVL
jgi:hypothetical protein